MNVVAQASVLCGFLTKKIGTFVLHLVVCVVEVKVACLGAVPNRVKISNPHAEGQNFSLLNGDHFTHGCSNFIAIWSLISND